MFIHGRLFCLSDELQFVEDETNEVPKVDRSWSIADVFSVRVLFHKTGDKLKFIGH